MSARFCPTLHERIRLIKEYEESGMSKSGFAKKHKIPRTSFIDILASKEKLQNSLKTFNGSKRRRLRKSNFEDIENALLKWIDNMKAKNIPLSGIILKEKAIEIAKELGNCEFSGSNGWLERFKERYGLSFKKISNSTMNDWLQCLALLPSGESSEKICDDSSSLIVVSTEEWKNSFLKYVLNKYQPSDIYSLGEVQLFYRFLPEIGPNLKINDQDQISLLLGVNMTGTDKLKPLVISKYVMPKCFINVNIQSLPVTYRSNSTACMSSELWVETIKDLDNKFENEKRKVAIILDICSLPTKIKGLKAIELIFMPPNIASILQPYNQEIFLNFKRNYRKFLIRDWLNAIDDNRNFNPTILDAILCVFKSWRNVSTITIKNCYKKAGFFVQDCVPEADDETDIEKSVSLAQLFQELIKRGKALEMDENSYLNIENTSILNKNTQFEVSAENCDFVNYDETCKNESEERTEKSPTKRDALKSFNIVRKYLLSLKSTTLKDHDCLCDIEHRIINSFSDNNP